MRVPLSWLREFVDVDLSPEELAEKLTLLGMEVSSIERIGADWHDIVVGELLEVAPHPNSSKLSLTRVRTGVGDEELSDRLWRHQHRKGPARPGRATRLDPARRSPYRHHHHRRHREPGHALFR